MQVTFEPHVGKHFHTGEKVEHDQYYVRIDGVHVGYVGKKKGRPVNFIKQMTSAELVAVKDAVNRELGWDPKTSQPIEIPESVMRQLRAQQGQDVDEEGDDDDE